MKILLRSPFSQFSGYGRDGIGMARALLDRGHEVRVSPSHVGIPVPRDIAGLMTYRHDPPFDVAIHHIETENAELLPPDAEASRVNILWSMWGWDEFPEEPWVDTLYDRTKLFDHVVLYDSLSRLAYEKVIGSERLSTVLGGYEAEDWGLPKGPVPPHPFTFSMVGKLTLRKGVYVAYEAMHLLKDEHGPEFDANLVLHTTTPVFPESYKLPSWCRVVPGQWLPEDLRDFYHLTDTLLAPSFAESKHLPPIEALACGTPVILSDIVGHRGWATSDFVTWVKTEPKTIVQGFSGFAPRAEDLATAMWDHYTNAPVHRLKAALGSRTVPSMLDWSKCVERLSHITGVRL